MNLKKKDITRAMLEAALSAPYANAKDFARFVIALNKLREQQKETNENREHKTGTYSD